MYTQTNVGLLCCVGSGSDVACTVSHSMALQCGDTVLSCLGQRAFEYDDISAVTNIRPVARRRPNMSLKQATYELFVKVNISCIGCSKTSKHVVMFCGCTIHLVLEYSCFLLFVCSPLGQIIKICSALYLLCAIFTFRGYAFELQTILLE